MPPLHGFRFSRTWVSVAFAALLALIVLGIELRRDSPVTRTPASATSLESRTQ